MNLNPTTEEAFQTIEDSDRGPAIGFPVPWNDKDQENNDDPGQLVIYIRDANQGFVAEVRSYPEDDEEQNTASRQRTRDIARLISANPTMYDALEGLIDEVSRVRRGEDSWSGIRIDEKLTAAVKALRAAKGEK